MKLIVNLAKSRFGKVGRSEARWEELKGSGRPATSADKDKVHL